MKISHITLISSIALAILAPTLATAAISTYGSAFNLSRFLTDGGGTTEEHQIPFVNRSSSSSSVKIPEPVITPQQKFCEQRKPMTVIVRTCPTARISTITYSWDGDSCNGQSVSTISLGDAICVPHLHYN